MKNIEYILRIIVIIIFSINSLTCLYILVKSMLFSSKYKNLFEFAENSKQLFTMFSPDETWLNIIFNWILGSIFFVGYVGICNDLKVMKQFLNNKDTYEAMYNSKTSQNKVNNALKESISINTDKNINSLLHDIKIIYKKIIENELYKDIYEYNCADRILSGLAIITNMQKEQPEDKDINCEKLSILLSIKLFLDNRFAEMEEVQKIGNEEIRQQLIKNSTNFKDITEIMNGQLANMHKQIIDAETNKSV